MDKLFNYETRLEEKYGELFKLQTEIINFYKKQWEEMNDLIAHGYSEEPNYIANAYGLKVKDFHIIQLDGMLPRIPKHNIHKYREHYGIAKRFISSRIMDICKNLNCKCYKEPVALIVMHYHTGNRLFDVDNKEKQIIFNSLKGWLFKDDDWEHLQFASEGVGEICTEPRTMLYIGPASEVAYMIKTLINEFKRIENLPNVVKGSLAEKMIKKKVSLAQKYDVEMPPEEIM